MHAFLYLNESDYPGPLPNDEFSLHINPETSIGIDEVRNIQKFLSRKPPRGNFNKIFIHSAEKLTLPAQNAILKTLEEPPGETQIYLFTAYPDLLLPTVLSRVQIVSSKKSAVITSDTLENSRTLWEKLVKGGVGERLRLIDSTGFDRESFTIFLSDLEIILHSRLSHISNLPRYYTLIYTCRKYLKSNVNLRLLLDYFALNI